MKRERDDAPPAAHGAGSNKRARGNSNNGNNRKSSGFGQPNSGSKVEVRTLKSEREEDPHRLAQRQKQIDYGKNTLGYDRYCAVVPRSAILYSVYFGYVRRAHVGNDCTETNDARASTP
jgi:hypothetical protein